MAGVEVGRVDNARNCGRSGQGWDAAVTDDVVLEDASRRLRGRLIAWRNVGCRLLGLFLLLQNLLLLRLNWWFGSTVQRGRRLAADSRTCRSAVAGLLSVGGG